MNSSEHADDEAFIIVKAAPRVSTTYGETVCIAAIDHSGLWVRLYPVSFRQLSDAQKFGRWDRIRYRWRKPKLSSDKRIESRRVDQNSIEIVGKLRDRDRHSFLNRAAVTFLRAEAEAGRSLAVLKCEIIDFRSERQTKEEMARQAQIYQQMRSQQDLFAVQNLLPKEVCPYIFKYRYRDADGEHEGTCQDWETEVTFLRRRSEMHSEAAALQWMKYKFGVEFPRDGMALAMGTHRWREHQWLINGVLRVDPTAQMSLF
ncbi:hypothetical protein M0638_21420 [Roseomonas sp. NAR14]|uniref:Uncharacterized protein n=1 Tax=Roseomonas acroporae TaxID=2937791 RepID=A0A9X1YBZ5_9PROT|nr:hypothetical protein [Roseomonas acroporae]MCK8786937.1 hypothetical protein [Roseomonas acroporae]